ncbi:hypothetical protein [Aureibacter tunicatorum]|uniref:Uncharacterized protein n=1 Tax=Aureibacter tunicatorum TaxID=866807 RepID=A0AAE3XH37_9BACT|nr:hypothetical protein [Aureibacter tunicatorum]MDR6237531.1 hypothetical protein [Aureibacter tunicatorum]
MEKTIKIRWINRLIAIMMSIHIFNVSVNVDDHLLPMTQQRVESNQIESFVELAGRILDVNYMIPDLPFGQDENKFFSGIVLFSCDVPKFELNINNCTYIDKSFSAFFKYAEYQTPIKEIIPPPPKCIS